MSSNFSSGSEDDTAAAAALARGDLSVLPWYVRYRYSDFVNETEMRAIKSQIMAEETAVVENWAIEAKQLIRLNQELSLQDDLGALQDVIAQLAEADAHAQEQQLLIEGIASIVNVRERKRMKRSLQYELLKQERTLLDTIDAARSELHQQMWLKLQQRHNDFKVHPRTSLAVASQRRAAWVAAHVRRRTRDHSALWRPALRRSGPSRCAPQGMAAPASRCCLSACWGARVGGGEG